MIHRQIRSQINRHLLLVAALIVAITPLPAVAQRQAEQLDPFRPLPPGTVVDAAGPVVPVVPPPPSNAVVIPPIDAEVVWSRLVDVVDDYFTIDSERRVVFAAGVPTEGRIDTFPQTGATLLEPWRRDSVGFRERLECTLQSIRRRGTIRMQPDPAGWRIEAVVDKELENLPRPMKATTGGATFRNDDSLYRYGTPLPTLGQQVGDQPRPVASPTRNAGWIPLGRDPLLERRMLDTLLARLGVAAVPQGRPYYQPPESVGQPLPGIGRPIPPEELPPGAIIAPGPPLPVESLPPPTAPPLTPP